MSSETHLHNLPTKHLCLWLLFSFPAGQKKLKETDGLPGDYTKCPSDQNSMISTCGFQASMTVRANGRHARGRHTCS